MEIRNFSTCWYGDKGLVVAGGYGKFRKRRDEVALLFRSDHIINLVSKLVINRKNLTIE